MVGRPCERAWEVKHLKLLGLDDFSGLGIGGRGVGGWEVWGKDRKLSGLPGSAIGKDLRREA